MRSVLSTEMTAEKVLSVATEIYHHEDGTITADYPLHHCPNSGGRHTQCVAVFKIEPCGCVKRRTWHYLKNEIGEIIGAKFDDGSGYDRAGHDCSKHRIRAVRGEYNRSNNISRLKKTA